MRSLFFVLIVLHCIACDVDEYSSILAKKGLITISRHGPATTCTDIDDGNVEEWWKDCAPNCIENDCSDPSDICTGSVARQLDPGPEGIGLVQDYGESLAFFGVEFDRTVSSEYCRCIKTSELMGFTEITTDSRLSRNIDYDCNRAVELLNELIEGISSEENILIVTHKLGDLGMYENDTESFGYQVCSRMSSFSQLHAFTIDPVSREIVIETWDPVAWINASIVREREFVEWDSTLSVTFIVVISLLSICTLGCLIFLTVIKRKRYEVIASSPLFLWIIGLGCIVSYLSVLTYIGEPTTTSCMLRMYLHFLGYSISFGTLFIKNYRILKIFKANFYKAVAITDTELIMYVTGLSMVFLIVLVVWTFVSPLHPVDIINGDVVDVACSGDIISLIMLILILSLTGITLIFGVYLAIQTRKVPTLFNEGMWIGFATYTLAIVGGITFPIGYILLSTNLFTLGTLLIMIGVCFWGTSGWAFILSPKIFSILTRTDEEARVMLNDASKSGGTKPQVAERTKTRSSTQKPQKAEKKSTE